MHRVRKDLKQRWLPRQDRTVWSQWRPDAPLTAQQADQFDRDGFLILKDIFTAEEVEALKAESAAMRNGERDLMDGSVITEPGSDEVRTIFKLPEHRYDLHGYLRGLEESMIDLLAAHDITGGRDERNTGVWVEGRKIAAIGIACRRWVTWHGFALNRDVELDYFRRINPCGMDAALVTRMVDHTPSPPSLEALAGQAAQTITRWWQNWTSPA